MNRLRVADLIDRECGGVSKCGHAIWIVRIRNVHPGCTKYANCGFGHPIDPVRPTKSQTWLERLSRVLHILTHKLT